MKKRISNVDPFQLGKVLAVLNACFGLVFLLFVLVMALLGMDAHDGRGTAADVLVMAFLSPVLYAVFGFIGGLIVALIYNLVAGWIGGIEFTMVDVAPPAELPGTYPRGMIQK